MLMLVDEWIYENLYVASMVEIRGALVCSFRYYGVVVMEMAE